VRDLREHPPEIAFVRSCRLVDANYADLVGAELSPNFVQALSKFWREVYRVYRTRQWNVLSCTARQYRWWWKGDCDHQGGELGAGHLYAASVDFEDELFLLASLAKFSPGKAFRETKLTSDRSVEIEGMTLEGMGLSLACSAACTLENKPPADCFGYDVLFSKGCFSCRRAAVDATTQRWVTLVPVHPRLKFRGRLLHFDNPSSEFRDRRP
jgi:hypothetical protein